MKHAKLLTASVGFLLVGGSVCLVGAWWFLSSLEAKDGVAGMVAVFGTASLAIGGLWWAVRGVRGLLTYLSPSEEEKIRWEDWFSRDEGNFRGGSRGVIITLGCIAIICFLLVGLYLR